MRIVAVDTVTEMCSAALLLDGRCLVRSELSKNRHSSLILPMLEDLLAEAGAAITSMDAVAFDRGPGSFTGVRIGAGVAQGLAFAADLPVFAVSSLWTLAAAAEGDQVLAAIDARMGQVYWSLVPRTLAAPEALVEHLDDPNRVRIDSVEVCGVGSGWDTYGNILEHAAGRGRIAWLPGRFPEAEWVARLAARIMRDHRGVAPEAAVPVYLRDSVVKR